MAHCKIVSVDFMVDGVDGQVRQNQAIAMSQGRIAAIGNRDAIWQTASPDSERVELGAVYLTPGLIDGHTHASLAGDGRTYAEMFDDTDEIMLLADSPVRGERRPDGRSAITPQSRRAVPHV